MIGTSCSCHVIDTCERFPVRFPPRLNDGVDFDGLALRGMNDGVIERSD